MTRQPLPFETMKSQPHAFFTRPGHSGHLTIEINSRTPSGFAGDKPMFLCLEIRQGMNPFWQYECGAMKSPLWNETIIRRTAATDEHPYSYIQLLRMTVSHLTGGNGLIGGPSFTRKPKLGFHSKYRQRKRALAESERLAMKQAAAG